MSNETETHSILTKKERQLVTGKPKHPLSAYNLFVRDHLTENDLKSAKEAYKNLSPLQRDKYNQQAEKVKKLNSIVYIKLKNILNWDL